MQLGVNAIYSALHKADYQNSEWLFGEGCGDNVTPLVGLDKGDHRAQLMRFDFATNNDWILKRWNANYQGIYRANQVIYNAPGMRVKDDEIEKRKYSTLIGQAKFLRALFYFNLVRTFGGVPIKPEQYYLNEGGSNNFIQARNTSEEVYEYIERDLREAILVLELDYRTSELSKENLGKFERVAAAALLAKVLAYQATPGVSHPKWTESLQFSEAIVQNGSLVVKDILKVGDLYTESELEELWYRLGMEPMDITSSINITTVTYSTIMDYDLLWHEPGEFSFSSLFEINFLNLQESSANVGGSWAGTIGTSGKIGVKLIQPSKAIKQLSDVSQDTRLLTSILAQTDSYPINIEGSQQKVGNISGTGYACYKWYTMEDETEKSRNMPVLRYGELLLFYAEALNELGRGDEAIPYLNQLVDRARLLGTSGRWRDLPAAKPDYVAPSNYLTLRNEIWNQRRIELAFEFDRFWDIVRTGQAEEFITAYNENQTEISLKKFFVKGVNEIFPIPQREIDLSYGKVKQNPGY